MFKYAFSVIPFLLAPEVLGITVTQLFQFPNATSIENVGLTSNGNLILNTLDQGNIFIMDPTAAQPQPRLLLQYPGGRDTVTGIAEVSPGVHAVSGCVAGDFPDFSDCAVAMLTVDDAAGADAAVATANIVAEIPEAGLLNGMAALPDTPNVVMSVDSINGSVFRTNTATGEVDIAIQDENLAVDTGDSPIGVNGVDINNGFLHITNSDRKLYARAQISAAGDLAGNFQAIKMFGPDDERSFDDFATDSNGAAYIARDPGTVAMVTLDGQGTILVGPGGNDDVTLETPTATVLTADERTLFVVTNGDPDNEIGGQVVQVDLD